MVQQEKCSRQYTAHRASDVSVAAQLDFSLLKVLWFATPGYLKTYLKGFLALRTHPFVTAKLLYFYNMVRENKMPFSVLHTSIVFPSSF